jgi:hypothetical protein
MSLPKDQQFSKLPLPLLPLLPFLSLSSVPVNLEQIEEKNYDTSTTLFIKSCDTLAEACFKYANNPREAARVREIFFQ